MKWVLTCLSLICLAVGAGVLVPHPGGDDERVARLPVELLAADDAPAAALGDVVDRTGHVAMRLCVLPLAQHLQVRARLRLAELQLRGERE